MDEGYFVVDQTVSRTRSGMPTHRSATLADTVIPQTETSSRAETLNVDRGSPSEWGEKAWGGGGGAGSSASQTDLWVSFLISRRLGIACASA